MGTIITTASRTQNSLNFMNNLSITSNNYLYQFIGQQTPWPNEPIPSTPVESVNNYKTVWDNMLSAKLVTLNNMNMVIARNNWITGNTYTAYTDTNTSLFSGPNLIYVMNNNNEVFKCLANNNGSPSTISPTGLGTTANNYVQNLSDGYSWKYMFNVAIGDQYLNTWWIPTYPVAPINSTQYTMQQSAIPGSIDYINITNQGINYINNPQSYIITILGDGTGANAYANVSGGSVKNIVMVNKGKDYTYANAIFSDPTGSGATATIIMPPFGGHGSNAVFELGATTVMISTFTVAAEQGFYSTSISFRQNGLLLNPLKFGSTTISSNSLINTCYTINLTGGIGNYSNNEIVYQGSSINNFNFLGTIIDFDLTTGIVRLNNTKGTPALGVILYGSSSGAQRYITNIINPDVQRYTGILIDLDNEPSIQRSLNQTEQYQYVCKF